MVRLLPGSFVEVKPAMSALTLPAMW